MLQVRQAEGALAHVRASVPEFGAALDAAMNARDLMLGSFPDSHRVAPVEAGVIPLALQIATTGSPGELLRR